MSLIRFASEPPDAFLLAKATFSRNGVRAEVPRRQPVWPGPSRSTRCCTVLTGWVSVPGFASLPAVEATRLHGLPADCPDDEGRTTLAIDRAIKPAAPSASILLIRTLLPLLDMGPTPRSVHRIPRPRLRPSVAPSKPEAPPVHGLRYAGPRHTAVVQGRRPDRGRE